jgi:hypothetical protein
VQLSSVIEGHTVSSTPQGSTHPQDVRTTARETSQPSHSEAAALDLEHAYTIKSSESFAGLSVGTFGVSRPTPENPRPRPCRV